MKVKDLGVAEFLRGIELRKMQEGMKEGDILLVQEKYVTEILKQFNMLDCKPASTPLEPSVKQGQGQQGQGKPCRRHREGENGAVPLSTGDGEAHVPGRLYEAGHLPGCK